MQQTKWNDRHFDGVNIYRIFAAAVLLAGSFAPRLIAQQSGQKAFSSAEDASAALFTAMQSNDEKALLDILGTDGKQIVSSGDATEDAQSRANFVQRYQEMHRLVTEPDGTTTLYIGAENWPSAIPLVSDGSSWHFDTAAGKKEILYRRIGRNEISTIKVCEQLSAAEREYHSAHNEYAQKILSDEGQQNGLYWKASAGQPQSPIGPLVARAVSQGYTNDGNPPTPYRGYYFHILKRQAASAPGGAKDYIANGKMSEGFAFVAYPAQYRSSGVMTFIVGADGTVYSKNLGPNTAALAKGMEEYNPDSGWKKDAGE